jgi:hypothetical protein
MPSSAISSLSAFRLAPSDGVDDGNDFSVFEGRPATDRIPGSREVERYIWIDALAQQEARQPGNSIVAPALADTVAD